MLSRTPQAILRSSATLRICRSPIRAASSQLRSLQSQCAPQQQQLRKAPPSLQPSHRKFSSTPAPADSKAHSNNVAGAAVHVKDPSPLSDSEYHEYAEHFFEELLTELERIQEEGSDIESEYSAGVLNIIVPGVGTYVLNKQPPNKQIWLSSPVSGPKRYDWIVERNADGVDTRLWVYLRDGSVLTDLLNEELPIYLPRDVYESL